MQFKDSILWGRFSHFVSVRGCEGNAAGKNGFKGFGLYLQSSKKAEINISTAGVPEDGFFSDQRCIAFLNVEIYPYMIASGGQFITGDFSNDKLKIPKTKFQINFKCQNPKTINREGHEDTQRDEICEKRFFCPHPISHISYQKE